MVTQDLDWDIAPRAAEGGCEGEMDAAYAEA